MKKNAMRKNLSQSILKSFGRYLAIIMIIALGASMFVGLLMTKFDMVATGQQYMNEQNMFDLRLISDYGWDIEHVQQIAQMDGVVDAEGVIYLDAVASLGDVQDNAVFRFYAIPERMNRIVLRGGRMPETPDECLVDGFMYGEELIGMQVEISNANEETTLDSFLSKTFTVVGIVSSPLYMDMNRGNTSIGSGSLTTYFYAPAEAFDLDYYVEINVTIPGDFDVYTDAYNDAMASAADKLEPMVTPLVEERHQHVYDDAMAEYEDGLKEYEDGLKEYEEEKAKALKELEDAYQELLDAEDQIAENEELLAYSQYKIDMGWEEVKAGRKQLEDARKQYEDAKAEIDHASVEAMKVLNEEKTALTQKIAGIDSELETVNEQLRQIQDSEQVYDETIAEFDRKISEYDQSIAQLGGRIQAAGEAIAEAEKALNDLPPETPQQIVDRAEQTIVELKNQKTAYETQRAQEIEARELLKQERENYVNSIGGNTAMNAQKQALLERKDQLLADKSYNQTRLDAVELMLENYDSAMKAVMDELAAAEAQIKDAENQIEDGRRQLLDGQKALDDGRKELEDAKVELADGWVEYEDGKLEAEEEFAKAEADLEEAKLLLDDAWDTIMAMDEPTIYVLDRNSNVGYGSLDSASDIVAGVSRVLPAFFLLVAALVCITTMTRMIDEERTQIGTLKALGYSNGAIISKYLIYAGSGAVIGCGLGVIVGSMAFPAILWEAYKIMLYITDDIVLQFNWWLCIAVVLAYTLVMLLVTWYCCRRTLEEEPAELIRPKAPEAGKKIFLEYLPFWHRISFLNKVTIRNIFRYRQRLAMMLVGIGGCTALLLTGFGLRDSIVNVVDFQFENVTVYDMTVYFSEDQTQEQQERFVKLTDDYVENVMFYNQISAELEYDNQVKELYLMTADSEIQEFVAFKNGDEQLDLPDVGEVLLTVGVTENMGISVGDRILMRNADMEQLELTVSGIYNNHVNNYAVLNPETIEDQWGRTPEKQMALIQVKQGHDVYEASTGITGLSGVQNVSISQDLADMVGSMMDALDLVIWVIVVCAGLLAVIVLYNLTNININERIREIATIKVLGFNASETAAYVFKENISLTVIGAGFGLGLGYLLLLFVMQQIKIDMVWFKAIVMTPSYIWSVALTMLSACIVNFVFYFKLDKINMAEALKSVE
ncbi:MAG: FtsX-like permease family protein [Oscillospiraceae bacterium]|nr:FtsX-like permease family protein [Oscillospiraceae bacterium]